MLGVGTRVLGLGTRVFGLGTRVFGLGTRVLGVGTQLRDTIATEVWRRLTCPAHNRCHALTQPTCRGELEELRGMGGVGRVGDVRVG